MLNHDSNGITHFESKMISKSKIVRWEIKNFSDLNLCKAETSVRCVFEMERVGNVPPSKWEFSLFRKGENDFKYELNWQLRLKSPLNQCVTCKNTVKILRGNDQIYKLHSPSTPTTGVVMNSGYPRNYVEETGNGKSPIKESFTGKLVDESLMKFNTNFVCNGALRIEIEFQLFGDEGTSL